LTVGLSALDVDLPVMEPQVEQNDEPELGRVLNLMTEACY